MERLEHEAANAESDAARVRSLELLGKTTDIKLFADIVETSPSLGNAPHISLVRPAKAGLGPRGLVTAAYSGGRPPPAPPEREAAPLPPYTLILSNNYNFLRNPYLPTITHLI